ncbi:hypothetical protein [Rhizobacter sp. Root1221]|uniref:hypothetical protein n=1 Tax=Rhizobacter sp. Root1221 TaxID=1736433 RepID=UPI0006F3042D|nr:hypothetical protein [Rhizobacter sp. Root1221]KQV79975.1 hypothetical protein ASC87_30400 [Rhizobacter sp. Root1221]
MLAYDNVGRLRHVGDGRMSIDIAYDKAGNRTQLRTHANVPNLGSAGEVSKDSDHRFTYDNMNRPREPGSSLASCLTLQKPRHTAAFSNQSIRLIAAPPSAGAACEQYWVKSCVLPDPSKLPTYQAILKAGTHRPCGWWRRDEPGGAHGRFQRCVDHPPSRAPRSGTAPGQT